MCGCVDVWVCRCVGTLCSVRVCSVRVCRCEDV